MYEMFGLIVILGCLFLGLFFSIAPKKAIDKNKLSKMKDDEVERVIRKNRILGIAITIIFIVVLILRSFL